MIEKIYIASDHAGFNAKKEILEILKKLNYKFEDLGPITDKNSVDYPDYAKKVATALQNSKSQTNFGILIWVQVLVCKLLQINSKESEQHFPTTNTLRKWLGKTTTPTYSHSEIEISITIYTKK